MGSFLSEENRSFIRELEEKWGFHRISHDDREIFDRFRENICFADLTFSLCTAWDFAFGYCIRSFGDSAVITGCGIDGIVSCCLLPAEDCCIDSIIEELLKAFGSYGYGLKFEYITEEQLGLFENSRYRTAISYDIDYSDYIYRTEDFVNLSGSANKGKRNELRVFRENNPGAVFKECRPLDKYLEDMDEIFSGWCSSRKCSDCRFGCEKTAINALFQVYDPDRFCTGIVYIGEEPVSFAVEEKINSRYVCCHFQKNIRPISGVTYFLHYSLCELHMDIPYLNWAEDMGIEGIRRNKSKYHPCEHKHKYTVRMLPN